MATRPCKGRAGGAKEISLARSRGWADTEPAPEQGLAGWERKRVTMGRRLEKFDVVDKMALRIQEWLRMAPGTIYNCGFDDQGMCDDWVSRATMDDLQLEWERRTSGARVYSTEWSIAVHGGVDFVVRNGGSKLCFRLRSLG